MYLGKIAKKEKEMQTETKKLIYYNYSNIKHKKERNAYTT